MTDTIAENFFAFIHKFVEWRLAVMGRAQRLTLLLCWFSEKSSISFVRMYMVQHDSEQSPNPYKQYTCAQDNENNDDDDVIVKRKLSRKRQTQENSSNTNSSCLIPTGMCIACACIARYTNLHTLCEAHMFIALSFSGQHRRLWRV